uniref:TFIIS-type domain-containing protein n=1 Tax=viral metagenome TaxID=1070528 RepID=A0A6C0J629_9ZZZZ
MTSSTNPPYVLYNLEEEIKKYTELNSNINRNKKENNTHNAYNKNQIREDIKELFSKKFKLSKIEIADLEIGIFNATIDYANSLKIQLSWKCPLLIDTYLNIARSLYSNLDTGCYVKNNYLLNKIKNKEFIPHNIAYMRNDELYPERWKNIIEKNKLKFKSAYEIKQVAMTDAIKCGHCKNNKISYYELQTRSGDEPMTQYFNCIVCGHKWKN